MAKKTTHLEGFLTNNGNEILPEGSIIVETTDQDLSYKGTRTKHKVNSKGLYQFKINEGYYNIYVLDNDEATQVFLGTVHVSKNDFNKVYTIEELLDK